MDQPTYTPVQRILEGRGTLFFSFQDMDATKPSGSIRIRIETIAYYLDRHAPDIMRKKLAYLSKRPAVDTPCAGGEMALALETGG